MDFFAQQDSARRQLRRLFPLVGVAVILLIVAHFVAIISVQRVAFAFRDTAIPGALEREAPKWSNPSLLLATAAGTLAVAAFLSLRRWRQLRADANHVAWLAGGRPLSAADATPQERRLLNVVEEIAIAACLPPPSVFVLDDEPSLNAFAAGISHDNASIAFTRGAMEHLTRDELQALAAHEIGHLAHGDVSLNTRLLALFDGLQFVRHLWRGIMHELRRFALRRFGNEHQKATMMAVGVAILSLAMVNPTMLLQILGTILVSFVLVGLLGLLSTNLTGLLRSAIGFEREFLADAAAVQFTRSQAGLAGVMDKIAGSALGGSISCHKAELLSHFFFTEGFSSFLQLWPTHPPLEERRQQIDPQHLCRTAITTTIATRVETDDARLRAAMRAAALATATISGALPDSAPTQTPGPPQNELPPRLREAAVTTEQAPFLVIAMLLAGDGDRRSAQLASFSLHFRDTVIDLETLARPLSGEARLALLQEAAAALSTLPPAVRNRLLATAKSLLDPASPTGHFERSAWALLAPLDPSFSAASHGTVSSITLVQREIAVTLSALAYRIDPAPPRAITFFQTAMERMPPNVREVALLPPERCGDEDLARALAALRETTPPIRDHVLTACAHLLQRHCQPLAPSVARAFTAIAETIEPLAPSATG